MRTLVIVGLLLGGVTGARAEQDRNSANFMMPAWRPAPDGSGNEFLEGVCYGIVNGISWMAGSVCPPAGVTKEQGVRVVIRYIDARPSRMHEDFKVLALEALTAAWPCR